jgi:hypothetical protein
VMFLYIYKISDRMLCSKTLVKVIFFIIYYWEITRK